MLKILKMNYKKWFIILIKTFIYLMLILINFTFLIMCCDMSIIYGHLNIYLFLDSFEFLKNLCSSIKTNIDWILNIFKSNNLKEVPTSVVESTIENINCTNVQSNSLTIDGNVKDINVLKIYGEIYVKIDSEWLTRFNKPINVDTEVIVFERLITEIHEAENLGHAYKSIISNIDLLDVCNITNYFQDLQFEQLKQSLLDHGLDSEKAIEDLRWFFRDEELKTLIDNLVYQYRNHLNSLTSSNNESGTLLKQIADLLNVKRFVFNSTEKVIKLIKELNETTDLSSNEDFIVSLIKVIEDSIKIKAREKLIVDLKYDSKSDYNWAKHGGISNWCYMLLANKFIMHKLDFRFWEGESESKIKAGASKVTPFWFYNYLLRLKYFIKRDNKNINKYFWLLRNLNLGRFNFWSDVSEIKEEETSNLQSDLITDKLKQKIIKDCILRYLKKASLLDQIYAMLKQKEEDVLIEKTYHEEIEKDYDAEIFKIYEMFSQEIYKSQEKKMSDDLESAKAFEEELLKKLKDKK